MAVTEAVKVWPDLAVPVIVGLVIPGSESTADVPSLVSEISPSLFVAVAVTVMTAPI